MGSCDVGVPPSACGTVLQGQRQVGSYSSGSSGNGSAAVYTSTQLAIGCRCSDAESVLQVTLLPYCVEFIAQIIMEGKLLRQGEPNRHVPASACLSGNAHRQSAALQHLPSEPCSILAHVIQALLCGHKCHSPFRPTASSNSSGWHATQASSLAADVVCTTDRRTAYAPVATPAGSS